MTERLGYSRPMSLPRRRLLLAALALPALAHAQDGAVRLIVGAPAGSGLDLAARGFAGPIGGALGVPVVVLNRPSAAGVLAAEQVAHATPDGTTLLYGSLASLAIAPALLPNLPYHPLRDFTHIAALASTGFAVAVPAASPARDVRGLVALLREKGTAANFGSSAAMVACRLAGAMLLHACGGQALHIPYQRSGDVIPALAKGDLDFAVDLRAVFQPHGAAQGALRLLAVTSAQHDPAAPGLPCLNHIYPDVELDSWAGISAPAGLPAELVQRVQAAAAASLRDPGVQELLRRAGAVAQFRAGREFTALVASDVARMPRLVAEAGLHLA